jgi:hypothetical protein
VLIEGVGVGTDAGHIAHAMRVLEHRGLQGEDSAHRRKRFRSAR